MIMKKTIAWRCWLVGVSLLAATVGWAKPTAQPTAAVVAAAAAASAPRDATLLAAPLRAFMPSPGPLTLRGTDGQATVFLPIATRLEVRRAVLHLVAKNSLSLLQGRSSYRCV